MILSGLKTSLNYPLVFNPGGRWEYGIGIDWLSQVVEAIDTFCREELFDLQGMPDTVVEPRFMQFYERFERTVYASAR